MVMVRLFACSVEGAPKLVGPPLDVVLGENDPQGWTEQEADQVTWEPSDVVAINGTLSPAAAIAAVGVIVMTTGGEDLPHPNSARMQHKQSNIRRMSPKQLGFIITPFPKSVDSRGTVVGRGTLICRE